MLRLLFNSDPAVLHPWTKLDVQNLLWHCLWQQKAENNLSGFSTGHSLNYYVSAQMIWYYRPFMKNEVGLYVLTLERFLRNIELKKQRANSECSSSTWTEKEPHTYKYSYTQIPDTIQIPQSHTHIQMLRVPASFQNNVSNLTVLK